MRITTEELREATLTLLAHLEDSGCSEFEFDEDFYWSVPEGALYNPYAVPAPESLTLGQLSDDCDEVRAIAQGKKSPLPYYLVWLAAVLKRVGQQRLIPRRADLADGSDLAEPADG
jgi:hypothetical protein